MAFNIPVIFAPLDEQLIATRPLISVHGQELANRPARSTTHRDELERRAS